MPFLMKDNYMWYRLGTLLLATQITSFAMENNFIEEQTNQLGDSEEEVVVSGDPIVDMIVEKHIELYKKRMNYYNALNALTQEINNITQFCCTSLISLDKKYHPTIRELAQDCITYLQAQTISGDALSYDILGDVVLDPTTFEDNDTMSEDELNSTITSDNDDNNAIKEHCYDRLKKLSKQKTRCYCSLEFGKSVTGLWKHISSRHKVGPRRFKCGKRGCNAEFSRPMFVIHHWGKEGNDCHNELFICSCKKHFLMSEMEKHRKTCQAPLCKKRNLTNI